MVARASQWEIARMLQAMGFKTKPGLGDWPAEAVLRIVARREGFPPGRG
jgi:hypothetical protein